MRQLARQRRLVVLAAGAIAVVGAALVAGIYGMAGAGRNATCGPALDIARRIAPLGRGEVAGVKAASRPLEVPDLRFRDADGKERMLSAWRGRTVLLNLWATWCVPCRLEMPALDALQGKLGGDAFEVVAVNIDTRDPQKPRAWLRDNAIRTLAYYADPDAKVFQDLKAIDRASGMPTTLLIDPAGCEIASLAGPAEWAGADALALINAALGR